MSGRSVWVPANRHGNKVTIHADPDCPRLSSALNIKEKPATVYPDGWANECGHCFTHDAVRGKEGSQ